MESTPSDSLLWDVSTASRQLRLSERYIQALVSENGIPFCRVGRRVLFDPEELKLWIKTRNVPAARK